MLHYRFPPHPAGLRACSGGRVWGMSRRRRGRKRVAAEGSDCGHRTHQRFLKAGGPATAPSHSPAVRGGEGGSPLLLGRYDLLLRPEPRRLPRPSLQHQLHRLPNHQQLLHRVIRRIEARSLLRRLLRFQLVDWPNTRPVEDSHKANRTHTLVFSIISKLGMSPHHIRCSAVR